MLSFRDALKRKNEKEKMKKEEEIKKKKEPREEFA